MSYLDGSQSVLFFSAGEKISSFSFSSLYIIRTKYFGRAHKIWTNQNIIILWEFSRCILEQMSVSQQLSNKSFFDLIAAIRKTDLTNVLNEVTDDTPPQINVPGSVYTSIYKFNISDINDNVCLNTTPNDVISDKYGKLFNPLDDAGQREPSISSELDTLLHTTRNIIKTDLYTSIRNPGVEASIQPNDTQYINSTFLKEGDSIPILNPRSTITLPSEFRQHLYENTKQFSPQTPYCIVYGTFTPKNKMLYHVSAAIVHDGHLYPFGWTNEKVLDNPRDKTVRPVQAILVSPETINPRWNYFIIDILLLTNDMLSKIESFFNNSVLKTTVDVYQPYTEGAAKDTLGIIFGENHLYVDKTRYTRIANNFTQVCFGFNCSSWIEYIFGIDCRLFSLSIMPSIPNYCKRAGYKSKFKIEVLHDIVQSIRTNDFSRFFQLINNVKTKQTKLTALSRKTPPTQEPPVALLPAAINAIPIDNKKTSSAPKKTKTRSKKTAASPKSTAVKTRSKRYSLENTS